MLKLPLGSGAGGGVLAHTHGGVALIHLAHFALLAVVVQAGICRQRRHKLRDAEALCQEITPPCRRKTLKSNHSYVGGLLSGFLSAAVSLVLKENHNPELAAYWNILG